MTARTLGPIVDIHSHAILDFGTGREVGLGRPIDTVPTWSVNHALDLMDQHGISQCILSVPNAGNIVEDRQGRRIARQVNEWLAGLIADHPHRFGAFATIPALTEDGALEETAYALDVLSLDGIATVTSINDIYLGDPRYDGWFEEMDRREVTLFVHPVVAAACRPIDLGLNGSMLEFMFDTTRMLTNMVFSGTKQRFHKMNVIACHAGGALPYLVQRLQTTQELFGPGPGRMNLTAEEVKDGFASFHYDLTAGTSPGQLTSLAQLVPTSQLLLGFDHPFMPDWSIDPAIADLTEWKPFSSTDLELVGHRNAERLFPALAARSAAG